MTLEDRKNLALAYSMAWKTVKGERCDVEVNGGWFTRTLYSGFNTPHANSMRLREIVRGLSILNTRIYEGDTRFCIASKRGDEVTSPEELRA